MGEQKKLQQGEEKMKKFFKLVVGLLILWFILFLFYMIMPYFNITSDEWAYDYNPEMDMPGENSIFIPGTGVAGKFTIVPHLDQDAVDDNDIIYCKERMGENHPFVIGHNYRSMKTLSQTEVGQYIYLSVNGEVEVYKVTVSEAATYDEETNTIVSDTGVSIYETYDGEKTIHLYTCQGLFQTPKRWIVLATLVDPPT